MSEHFINSESHWDSRFAGDWQNRGGREQTRFFAELALKHLPSFVLADIRYHGLKVMDWGCAEGDGVEVLARELNTEVMGVDFSREAINTASTRFPGFSFKRSSIEDLDPCDVLFTSNTLEHFDAPHRILGQLLPHARKYGIILVPFQEGRRHEEHLATFDFNSFPLKVGRFHAIALREIDSGALPDSKWPGKQILVVYGHEDKVAIEEQRLSNMVSDLSERLDASVARGVALERRIADAVAQSNKTSEKVCALEARERVLLRELAGKDHLESELNEVRSDVQRLEDAVRKATQCLDDARVLVERSYMAIREVRTRRLQKLALLASSLKQHPRDTVETTFSWLLGRYKNVGMGLVGALSAHALTKDKLFGVEQEIRRALGGLSSCRSKGAPEGDPAPAGISDLCARMVSWDASAKTIALQVESFDKGGLEEVVLTLARNLKKSRRVNVTIFVAGNVVGYLGKLAEDEGIPVVALHGSVERLRAAVKAYHVDLVHLHYSVFGVLEYSRAGLPIVYTIHNCYVWADEAFIRQRAAAYGCVNAFIAVSDAVGRFFVSRFGISGERVMTIPNGLDLAYVEASSPVARRDVGLSSEEDVVFINIASFNWLKFHALMVAAMERLVGKWRNAKLLFVGNTHEKACRDYVESEIARRGLGDSIRILDYVPKARLMGLMAMSDCFILPSIVEGASIAVLEAMYAGLPLVLSDVGAARTMIEQGDIGLIVQNPYHAIEDLTWPLIVERYTRDPQMPNLEHLVAAMAQICADKGVWRERGRKGRAKVERLFNSSIMSTAYLDCYERQMAKRASELENERSCRHRNLGLQQG